MATDKQIAANQANAQKSTGPKTDGGKLAVSKNAMKHGALSSVAVHLKDAPSIRRLVTRAKLEEGVTSGLSGHSMRDGAAKDMMVAGLDHIAIMQAGGWVDTHGYGRPIS